MQHILWVLSLGWRAAGGSFAMPKVNPLVNLFAALVAALAAFIVPVFLLLRADIAEVRGEVAEVRVEVAGNAERLTRIEAVVDVLATTQAEHGQRLTRIEDGLEAVEAGLEAVETVQAEHGQRLTRIEDGLEAVRMAQAGLEDGQTAVRGDLSATNERLARVEGTVAGVLARAFPDRMAQAPEPQAGAGG